MNDDAVKDQIDSALGSMGEEELRRLAADIVDDRVFTSAHVPPEQLGDLKLVFMVLMFLGDSKGWLQDAGMLFEYMDKAAPRTINGMPMFFSVRKVIKKDIPALTLYMNEYRAIKEKFLARPPEPQIPPLSS
jgi:hypothetical protein